MRSLMELIRKKLSQPSHSQSQQPVSPSTRSWHRRREPGPDQWPDLDHDRRWLRDPGHPAILRRRPGLVPAAGLRDPDQEPQNSFRFREKIQVWKVALSYKVTESLVDLFLQNGYLTYRPLWLIAHCPKYHVVISRSRNRFLKGRPENELTNCPNLFELTIFDAIDVGSLRTTESAEFLKPKVKKNPLHFSMLIFCCT